MRYLFREVVCFLVGSFGVVPFCVHTIVYNTLPLLFMFPMGIGIGLTVRIGTELPKSAKKAKMMAAWCMGFTVILAMIVSLLLYQMRIPIVSLFTNDEEVLQVISLPNGVDDVNMNSN
jgi:MATE family multidrug resistance protein